MKILIVGAGIAGLSAAKAFESKGYRPEIVERSPKSATAGHSIFLLGNAMRALSLLGVGDEVIERACPIPSQTIMSAQGKVLNHVLTEPVWQSSGPCMAMRRDALIDVLYQSLSAPRITFETTVMRTILHDRGRRVHFSDGRIEDYDLVVGADGIRSSIRASTFTATAPRSVGLSAWRLLTTNTYGVSGWTAMLGRGKTLLAIPLSETELYVYADCSTADFGDGSLKTLKRTFDGFAPPLGKIVSNLTDNIQVHRSDIEEVPYSNYVAERLVLIGDSAHAASPSMAQGAAMALEDAVTLADCLARPQPLLSALTQFYAFRKDRVEWVQRQSRSRDRLRTAPDIVRKVLLRALGDRLYRTAYGVLLEPFPR